MKSNINYLILEEEIMLSISLIEASLEAIDKWLKSNDENTHDVAFFCFYNGIEKLLKIIFSLQLHNQNKAKEDIEKALKKHSHNIAGLYQQVINPKEDFWDKNGFSYTVHNKNANTFYINPKAHIISEITEFAKKDRYYNLNNILNPKAEKRAPVILYSTLFNSVKPIVKEFEPNTTIYDYEVKPNLSSNLKDDMKEIAKEILIKLNNDLIKAYDKNVNKSKKLELQSLSILGVIHDFLKQ
jgi:hypothetical protein